MSKQLNSYELVARLRAAEAQAGEREHDAFWRHVRDAVAALMRGEPLLPETRIALEVAAVMGREDARPVDLATLIEVIDARGSERVEAGDPPECTALSRRLKRASGALREIAREVMPAGAIGGAREGGRRWTADVIRSVRELAARGAGRMGTEQGGEASAASDPCPSGDRKMRSEHDFGDSALPVLPEPPAEAVVEQSDDQQPPIYVVVSSCASCPFSVEPSHDDCDWLCSAVDSAQDLQIIVGDPGRSPPGWCPLRRTRHLVKLGDLGPDDRPASTERDPAPHVCLGDEVDEVRLTQIEASLREYAALPHAEHRLSELWLERANAIDAGLTALRDGAEIEARHREALDVYLARSEEARFALAGATVSIVSDHALAIRALLRRLDRRRC